MNSIIQLCEVKLKNTHKAMSQENKNLKLIDSTFSAVDASEVLMSLIADKLKFHNMHILSQRESTLENTINSEQRIKELITLRNEIKEILTRAHQLGQMVKINCDINFSFIKAS